MQIFKKLASFRRLLKDYWQYRVLLILVVLHTDVLILLLNLFFNLSPWTVIFITLPLATAELPCWYWFWRWFRREEVPRIIKQKIARDKRIQEAIKLGEKVKIELEESGHWDLILILYEKFSKATDENNKIVKKIKRFGHLAIFALGAEPFPLGRSISFIFCGATGWRSGLVVLMLGNVFHVISAAFGLHGLISLLGWIF